MEEIKMCCYGCGRESKFIFKNGKECCSENMNHCPAIIEKRKDASFKLWKYIKARGNANLKEIGKKTKSYIKPDQCEYGCGQEAKYQLKNKKWCCENFSNKCPVNRQKVSEKIKLLYLSGQIKQGKHIYHNLPQETKDRMAWSKGKPKKLILG